MRINHSFLPDLSSFVILTTLMVVSCNMPDPATFDTPIEIDKSLSTQISGIQPTITSSVRVQPTDMPATITPLPQIPAGGKTPIQFAANGTYADMEESISAGESRSYSINAMQGQVMSISILPKIQEGQWGYVPFRLSGTDGTVICPADVNSECVFWRGALPSSGEYILTLSPEGDAVNFTMRVAINPPGKEIQYFNYNDPAKGWSLSYPDYFAPSLPPPGNYKTAPVLALHFIDTGTYEETNLIEAYFLVSASSDPQLVATCTESNENAAGPEQVGGNETVNGYNFIVSGSEGAGAGNYYEQIIHRSAIDDACFEVIYFIHYTNIGNYPPGTIVEFDREALLQKFDAIFSTFGND